MKSATRKNKTAIRMVVNTAMAVVFVLIMATAIVDGVAHEWLGIALFLLAIAHVALNRKFFVTLLRGRYSVLRIVCTCLDTLVIISICCLVASSLVLSQHAFSWLPALPGVAWARPMHMLASYWGFLLVFLHVGLHVPASLRGQNALRKTVWAIVHIALILLGATAFIRIGMANYLFLGMQFVFIDPVIPIWGYALLYAAVALGAMSIGSFLRYFLKKQPRDKRLSNV